QNKITEYRAMLQQWRDSGAITCAAYILCFPGDTKESILRDVEIIKRELPLDLLEFFFLTPLPGSEDQQKLSAQGVWMDPDLNKYDLNHRVSHHPKMSDEEWEEAYRAACDAYYTPEHVRTILRRTAANPRGRIANTIGLLWWFCAMTRFEGVHPLEGGGLRLKFRRDRRSTLPRESALRFYPRYAVETVRKVWGELSLYREWTVIRHEVTRDPNRWNYTDLAIAPPREDELDTLDLYHATSGGEAALARQRRHDAIRDRAAAVGGGSPDPAQQIRRRALGGGDQPFVGAEPQRAHPPHDRDPVRLQRQWHAADIGRHRRPEAQPDLLHKAQFAEAHRRVAVL